MNKNLTTFHNQANRALSLPISSSVIHIVFFILFYITAVLASNGVFRKVSDTQFIIIVDNDTMVYIIYPKCDDAIVHQIAEIYYGIYSIPKILLCYIITKYHHMLPRYLKENQAPLITSWQFFIYLFLIFSVACYLFSDACMNKYHKTT